MAFTLPELPYAFDALEPVIDTQTMQIHHGKHHAAYVANLNKALEGSPLAGKSLEEIFKGDMPPAVRNNGGGHYNHSLFWKTMTKPGTGGAPSAELAKAIEKDLGGIAACAEKFTTAATTRFGSGWAWLCVKADKTLCVCSTPNQDNPLMVKLAECPGTPILGLDVWEHAYYLKYQNRRPDYVKAFFEVINWPVVSANYAAAVK